MKNIQLGLFCLSSALLFIGCNEHSITLSEDGLSKSEPRNINNEAPASENLPTNLESNLKPESVKQIQDSSLAPISKKLESLVNKRINLNSIDQENASEMDHVFYEYLDNQYFQQTVELLDEVLTRLIENRWSSEDHFADIYETLYKYSYVLTPKGIDYGISSNLERAYTAAILVRIDERLDGGILMDLVDLWDVYENTASLSLLADLKENYPSMNFTKDYSEEAQRAILQWLKAAVDAQVYEPSKTVFTNYLERLEQEIQNYATPIQGRTPKTPYPYESETFIYSIQNLIRLEAELPEGFEIERNKIYEIIFEALLPWDKVSPDQINEQIIPLLSLLSDHHEELAELVENHRNVYAQKLDTEKRFNDEQPQNTAKWNEYVTRSNAVILELRKSN